MRVKLGRVSKSDTENASLVRIALLIESGFHPPVYPYQFRVTKAKKKADEEKNAPKKK